MQLFFQEIFIKNSKWQILKIGEIFPENEGVMEYKVINNFDGILKAVPSKMVSLHRVIKIFCMYSM